MTRLIDKVAIVTGAASGMGKATAIRLASEGARAVLGDIDGEGARATASEIEAAGGSALVVEFDAADEASCMALVQSAVDSHGRLDVVANVAGISSFYHLHETTAEIFNRVLAINLTSILVICREAVPHLLETGGNMVNFSSINARYGSAYHAAYDASKAGVLALTKSIAQEFGKQGVRCNAICPGGIDTPMNVGIRMPADMDMSLIARLSSGDVPFGKPEEVAAVVAFLASSDASYVNGEQIVVDGGVTSII